MSAIQSVIACPPRWEPRRVSQNVGLLEAEWLARPSGDLIRAVYDALQDAGVEPEPALSRICALRCHANRCYAVARATGRLAGRTRRAQILRMRTRALAGVLSDRYPIAIVGGTDEPIRMSRDHPEFLFVPLSRAVIVGALWICSRYPLIPVPIPR
jgi:hypothetical protein